MHNVDLTVIVPCYNTEKNVSRTINSIRMNQRKYFKIEVVAIDLNSADNTLKKLNEIASSLTDISLQVMRLDSINESVSHLIKGKYFAICYAPYEIPDDYYFVLYQQACYNKIESVFHSYYYDSDGEICIKFNGEGLTYLNAKEQVVHLLSEDFKIPLGLFSTQLIQRGVISLKEVVYSWFYPNFISKVVYFSTRVAISRSGGWLCQSISSTPVFTQDLIAEFTEKYINFLMLIRSSDREGVFRNYFKLCLSDYCSKNKTSKMIQQIERLLSKMSPTSYPIINWGEEKNFCLYKKKRIKNTSKIVGKVSKIDVSIRDKANSDFLSSLFQILKLKIDLFLKLKVGSLKSIFEDLSYLLTIRTTFPNSLINKIQELMQTIDDKYLLSHPEVFVPWLLLLRKRSLLKDLSSYLSIPSLLPYFSQYEDISLFSEFRNIESMSRVLQIYDRMVKDRVLFEQYCSSKTLSIVGNAPNEKGKRKGKIIDEADAVFRFNNYQLTADFKSDYGEKENVWCISPDFSSILARNSVAKYDYIITTNNDNRYSKEKLRVIESLQAANIKFVVIDVQDILPALDIRTPTLGAMILYYMHIKCSQINKENFFGFSLLDSSVNCSHYFKGDPSDTKSVLSHQWNRESFQLKKLLSQ